MGERRELFSCCHILKYVRIGEEGEVSLLISIESPTLHYATIQYSAFFSISMLDFQSCLILKISY